MGHKGNGLEHLEADWLYYSHDISNLSAIPGSDIVPTQLTVKRNANLTVTLEMSGTDKYLFQKEQARQVKAGTVSASGSMSGEVKHAGYKVELIGVTAGRKTSNFSGEYTIHASASSVRITRNDSEPKSAIIYAVGCPKLLFHRGTCRDVEPGKVTLSRRHVGDTDLGPFGKLSFNSHGESRSSSTDYLLIKNKYGTVIFSKGEPSSETEEYSPCYLQFIDGQGITDRDFRRRYLEAVSFALGKRLIEIGHSTFSEDHQPICQESRAPYSLNIKKEAAIYPLPPSENVLHGQFPSEEGFSQIVEGFLDNYESLDLSNVIWPLWIARLMPLGTELVSYSSSLESLVTMWFKNKEPQKNEYVDSDLFKSIVGSAHEQVSKASMTDELKATLSRKLDLANHLSIGDKKKRFFESLGLGFGKIEKKTIASRNKYAHGGSVKDADTRDLVILARCYEALINRALLAAIGSTGNYVDYSSYDFPERSISVEMAGTNFDKN